MAATVEKMATDVSQGKAKKGRKSSNATKKRNPSVCSPAPHSSEAGKENSGVPVVSLTPNGRKNNKETLKNVSNIISTPPTSLEEELLAVRMRLQKLNLEKEKTEKMLEERDAMLKEKEAELERKGKAQEKLQMELRRLQKLKEFKPVISIPLEQPLHVGELAMEKEENKKKKSDPNRPKKPSAPYMLWVHDQWNQVKSENPNIAFKDMGAILGAKWKSLSAEEKKPYEEKYGADKEAYQQVVGQEKRQSEAFKLLHKEQKQKTALDLLDQYLEYRKDAEGDEKSKRRKEKDPSKPKQPISAFFAFSNERRAALLVEKSNLLEVSKILGVEWNNMTKEQRAPYEKIAMEAKEQYTHELESYKQKKAEEESAISKEEEEKRKIEKEEALRLLRKKEKEEKLKKTMNVQLQQKRQQREKSIDPDKPKKPSTSFLLFSKDTRKKLAEERPAIDNKTISALISVKWKELDDVEKRVWEEQAANAMVQYKMDMENYKKLKQQTPSEILCNPEEMQLGNSSVTTTIS